MAVQLAAMTLVQAAKSGDDLAFDVRTPCRRQGDTAPKHESEGGAQQGAAFGCPT